MASYALFHRRSKYNRSHPGAQSLVDCHITQRHVGLSVGDWPTLMAQPHRVPKTHSSLDPKHPTIWRNVSLMFRGISKRSWPSCHKTCLPHGYVLAQSKSSQREHSRLESRKRAHMCKEHLCLQSTQIHTLAQTREFNIATRVAGVRPVQAPSRSPGHCNILQSRRLT